MITPGGRVGDASPLGKGKGKRRVLDDYVREVAHALIRKGVPEGHAIAIAKNSLKRWRRGGGKVRPQVRAGAAAHLGIQEGLDKRRGGGVNLATPIGASVQDGPRATMHAMATAPAFGGKKAPPFTKGGGKGKKGKMRPGSIPSGKGKGKFPITDQKSVQSAASLLSKAKGVSRAAVVAHVRAEAKKRGLKLTPAFKPKGKSANLTQRDGAMVQVVDLVGPKGFSHGWIRGGAPSKPIGSKPAGDPALKSIKDRTEAEHKVMRDRAVKMHGSPGGHRYDELRKRNGVPHDARAVERGPLHSSGVRVSAQRHTKMADPFKISHQGKPISMSAHAEVMTASSNGIEFMSHNHGQNWDVMHQGADGGLYASSAMHPGTREVLRSHAARRAPKSAVPTGPVGNDYASARAAAAALSGRANKSGTAEDHRFAAMQHEHAASLAPNQSGPVRPKEAHTKAAAIHRKRAGG